MGTNRPNASITSGTNAQSRRRRALAVGAMALGAAAGSLITRESAEAHGTVHYDSNTEDPAVHGNNTFTAVQGNGGAGVLGTSVSSAGVRGVHTSPTWPTGAVIGVNQGAGAGVVGRAVNGPGVRGIAPGFNPGVAAQSGSQPPPNGDITLDGGVALLALGHTILRLPTAADGILALDPSFTGPTLRVMAGARVDALCLPVGNGTILARQRTQEVIDAAASPTSRVSVVLVSSPDADDDSQTAISWIERAAGSFTVHLTRQPKANIAFTYTIVNP